ncbi:uncharacterized protein LOC115590972 [Sparus aurata]|uniref:uncharacterized protein LOC115590972 n=1 Tax=Sparus aurata TaxID=8175 RepID=UPI0011C12569|nr:uncharacterized protein LOC115590972 [Sparus aurata]XP_030288347.1 uncharacterized protein LOC115590972 [Sparus aurata]XP_030288348.1 uncharacterized protein LOC115590972 [Sparus aurata]
MCCVLCKPKVHEVLTFKNSPSNLRKHIQRTHERHLERYTKLTTLKRKNDEEPKDQAPKQVKLWEGRHVSQKSVDNHIVDFVVQGLHPLSVVEEEALQHLVHHLQPNAKVMARNTMKSKIEKATQEMKKNLKVAMRDVEFIGTTTDCWTAHRKGFIGVTAHWIQPTSLQRCCAALACKQLKGPHNFTALADALTEIHTEFNIRDKIVRTTTDSGSNFVKAFRVYGVTEDENNNAEPLGAEPDQSGEEDSEEDMVESVEAGPLLEQDDGLEYQLPKQHRCACHLLNLVATVDVKAANDNPVYIKLSRSSFAKCQALWNKSSRSTTASEIIEEHCKLQLLRPCETRWNSLFYAIERIVRIIKEQGEAAIAAVSSALKILMFTSAEIAFLTEYAETMSPVAGQLAVFRERPTCSWVGLYPPSHCSSPSSTTFTPLPSTVGPW